MWLTNERKICTDGKYDHDGNGFASNVFTLTLSLLFFANLKKKKNSNKLWQLHRFKSANIKEKKKKNWRTRGSQTNVYEIS